MQASLSEALRSPGGIAAGAAGWTQDCARREGWTALPGLVAHSKDAVLLHHCVDGHARATAYYALVQHPVQQQQQAGGLSPSE